MKTAFSTILLVAFCSGYAYAGSGTPQGSDGKIKHLQFISTYLQPGTENPDSNYLTELLGNLSASHMGPEFFGSVRETLQPKQAILDLADEMFNFDDSGSLKPNYQDILDDLGKKYIDGHKEKILAFYIADEPTGYGITRDSLQRVIAVVKARFPQIPTYIVWSGQCFDNSAAQDDCGLPGQRGIPAGLDWIGFDWYLSGSPADDQSDFKSQIIATVKLIKRQTSLPIVLIPDGTDEFLTDFPEAKRDSQMASRMKLFYDYAQSESRIIGLDNYAWANHVETFSDGTRKVNGLREYPLTKNLLFKFAAAIRQ